MFCVIYRWKIHEGQEAQFENAWSEVTELIRKHQGGLGSVLHRCEDGAFLAYARWPSRELWEKSKTTKLPNNEALENLKTTIAKAEPPILMQLRNSLLS